MHPAASVVLFTTASGAGYGLLFWLTLLGLCGQAPRGGALGLAGLGVALALVSVGLISSTFHLGRPERAWRALTQWRSSWLSREGVAALGVYAVSAPLALAWIFPARFSGLFAAAAAATLVMAVVTIVCTAMIYASLKPIRQWSDPWTLPVYLALAAATGALLWVDLTLAFGLFRPAYGALALATLCAAAGAKLAYWRSVDKAPPRATLASATGLSAYGAVRLLEAPHTEENFVMREMGFRIARKHAARLRRIVVVMLFAAPLALAASLGAPSVSADVGAGLASLSVAVGVGVERWLFFAQATHVSMLYYGGKV